MPLTPVSRAHSFFASLNYYRNPDKKEPDWIHQPMCRGKLVEKDVTLIERNGVVAYSSYRTNNCNTLAQEMHFYKNTGGTKSLPHLMIEGIKWISFIVLDQSRSFIAKYDSCAIIIIIFVKNICQSPFPRYSYSVGCRISSSFRWECHKAGLMLVILFFINSLTLSQAQLYFYQVSRVATPSATTILLWCSINFISWGKITFYIMLFACWTSSSPSVHHFTLKAQPFRFRVLCSFAHFSFRSCDLGG